MSDQNIKKRGGDGKIPFDILVAGSGPPQAIPFAEGYYAVSNIFGTVGFVVTGEGVVVVDSGISDEIGETLVKLIREITDKPIKYLIYTHGHADHVKGAKAFQQGGAVIIAQRNVSRRFRRYTKFAGYHARINGIQGGGHSGPNDTAYWSDWVYPDIEYTDTYDFELGGKQFHLNHEYGETDDATVVTVAQDSVIFSGDLITQAFPNIGNPNKVIRYEHEWFEALDRIAAKKPAYVVSGHGAVLEGEKAIAALHDTAKALRILYEDSAVFINEGRDLDDIIEHAALPENLLKSPYIPEIYGTREFVLRGIHRRYTGWYDGNPSNLNPAPKADIAKVTYELIGSKEKILEKAKAVVESGNLRLALHILDLSLGGDPEDKDALQLKAWILRKLGIESGNLFYANFYLHAAEQIERSILE